MLRSESILETLRMFQEENLDVRTVTLGVNLLDCRGSGAALAGAIRDKVQRAAEKLVATAESVGSAYGIPVVNKRIAVSPMAIVAGGSSASEMVDCAHALDEAAAAVGVDFIGGFAALAHTNMTPGSRALIEALPTALAETKRVCGALNVASTTSGINMDAVLAAGHACKRAAELSRDADGFAAAKMVVFANMPEANPFMAGAVHGIGQGDAVVNIGVSGPGVVKRALERLIEARDAEDPGPVQNTLSLAEIAEEIKVTAFRITRVGELIGREVAKQLHSEAQPVNFGVVDLSLAPTPKVGDSIGEILQVMGIRQIGGPGSTAAVAMLNDAIKKGGAFASSTVGGLSGAFIPPMEDAALAEAVANRTLTLEKLEAMTSVCSVGLDMVAIPGDVTPETIAGIIADEMAIGVINRKTTATRLIAVPGKKAGEVVRFGGLFGESVILPVLAAAEYDGANDGFVRFAGRVPAPLHSLRN